MENRPICNESFLSDGRTERQADMQKLKRVAFRGFAKAPEN
jgi:hypothetical protein